MTENITPREELLDLLYKLQQRSKYIDGDRDRSEIGNKVEGMNLLESYDHFVHHSDHGRSCGYALKIQKLFYAFVYKDIKALILQILKLIETIEGKKMLMENDEKRTI